MAGNIKGITIEFRGDTTKLDKALRQVNNETKKIDRELQNVNKALKFNPQSVELWSQKQTLLTKKISETEDKLELLKREQKEMDAKEVDKNSAEYRNLQREIIETESKLKTFKAQLKQIGNVKLKALSEELKKVGKKMTDVGKNLTKKVTAPIVAVGAVATNKFAEVDKVMQLTNSTMGNTEEQAQLLNQAMKSAAASSTYGMSDAANATLNFARAGLSAEEAANALAPAMALAAGEGGNLDTVSGGLVATINGFHDSFENAGTYADVFANACNNSALDVDSLSEAMSVAAPIFAAAGYSVNDAALYMGVMANNGIEADKAANSLKTGLARLVSPAKDGAEMMDQLGISVTNADGTMKDTVTIQKELHDAFSQLSESEQLAAASAIFGKNQMSPWLALINTAPSDVETLSAALGESGTAMEMQADMMSGFGGSIEQLKSGLDVLATSFGEALAPTIQVVVDLVQKLVDWFNSLSPKTQSIIATIATVVAALGPVLVILGTLISSVGSVIGVIGKLGGAFSAVKGIATAVIGVIGSSGAIFLGVAAVIIALAVVIYKNWDKIKAWTIALKDKIVQTFTNIKNRVVTTVQGMIQTVKDKWTALKTFATDTFNKIKDAIVTPIKTAIDKVKGIIEKVKGFFPIKVGKLLSGLKLPHFKLTGKFSLKDLTVPHLSVDWYKTGGIFDSPSVIGVGEAGTEAVVPLDKLWNKLDNLQSGETVVNIYVNGANKDPVQIAQEVKRILIKEVKGQNLAFG